MVRFFPTIIADERTSLANLKEKLFLSNKVSRGELDALVLRYAGKEDELWAELADTDTTPDFIM